jgi:hypothetical protein
VNRPLVQPTRLQQPLRFDIQPIPDCESLIKQCRPDPLTLMIPLTLLTLWISAYSTACMASGKAYNVTCSLPTSGTACKAPSAACSL